MFEPDVFERRDRFEREISGRNYNLIIGLVLLWGFSVNGFMVATIPVEAIVVFPIWVILLGYFLSCFFGVFLFSSSESPIVSFIGYNFVVIPFGLIINLAVSIYDPNLVLKAIKVTGIVTVFMLIAGILIPSFFKRIYSALTLSLFIVIVIEMMLVYGLGLRQNWIDWAVAIIFCGYIGYDWGRANQIPKTVDNAVDSAAALYMDIINLFLRVLRIMGRK
ncbi:Bax inhibitor-1 family protein [Vibrio bivalvicida]|uniref:Bax inhibitor-1 family protein n=1 Tax=Vibrio bivalvicida TaxID=1276888 RepID=A0ABV4MQG7_9VIBR